MASSQESYNPIEKIEEWRRRQLQDASSWEEEKEAEKREVSRLCQAVLALFEEIARSISRSEAAAEAQISLERSRGGLVLWSDGHGVARGEHDTVFSRSRKLHRITTKALSHISNTLLERLIPRIRTWSDKLEQLCLHARLAAEEASHAKHKDTDSQSDASSTSSSDISADDNDNIGEIAEDLRTDVRYLVAIEPLLRNPILDSESESTLQYLNHAWAPAQLYADKIESRYPLADKDLVIQLAEANFRRYLRCQAEREAHEKTETQVVAEEPETAGTVITASRFHDSGIGTSIAPTLSYAETVMSYGREGQSVRIPPLPEGAKKGDPFSCIACGRLVRITNNSTWKRHIYLDLQPYTCLIEGCVCGDTSFATREHWISHLASDHAMEPEWTSIKCRLCTQDTGSGKGTVTLHLAKHLEEISLSALPAGVDSNTPSDEGASEATDGELPNASNVSNSGLPPETFI
ncbi:hypothetical protein QBC34DRAFT_332950, partial [Podospora aff. communis PSN243]